MKVSVIVPVLNGERELPDLLRALTAQTYAADQTEIICVDNNSTDGTATILAGWADRGIRTIECALQGSYAARNAGINAATGEVLAFTDTDCRPTTTWLSTMMQGIVDGFDRMAGPVHIPVTATPSIWELFDASFYLDQEKAVQQGWAATANLVLRRSVIERVGPFNEALISWGDKEFGYRCTTAGISLGYSPRAAVMHNPRTSAMDLIRRSRRIGIGQAQIAHYRLATHARSRRSALRGTFSPRLKEERLAQPLTLPQKVQLQAFWFGVLGPVQFATYLLGRWLLRRASVPDVLATMAHSERRPRRSPVSRT